MMSDLLIDTLNLRLPLLGYSCVVVREEVACEYVQRIKGECCGCTGLGASTHLGKEMHKILSLDLLQHSPPSAASIGVGISGIQSGLSPQTQTLHLHNIHTCYRGQCQSGVAVFGMQQVSSAHPAKRHG